MSSYLRLRVQQLSSLSDGDLVMLTRQYFRHVADDHLEQGESKVILLGLPFSWMPHRVLALISGDTSSAANASISRFMMRGLTGCPQTDSSSYLRQPQDRNWS